MKYENATIAAIATSVSPSGISIIRISGPDAFLVIDRIYRSKGGKTKLSEQKSHTIHYGYICENNKIIDEVMVSIMRAPRSYTAEDTIEINCHGGVWVTKKILDLVLENGASPAEPGEFTKRAYLNGRIDLSEAEAVMDVISANNQYALQLAVGQLQGKIFNKIKELRDDILDAIAFIEAALDDPEHISLDGYSEKLNNQLSDMKLELLKMLKNADDGRIVTEGINTVILGKPNAGKSSLLNVLSGEERAIVTEIAGTTRDTLEEQLIIDGINFNIIDTAGIRTTEDVVEKIGVERALEAAKKADLILYMVDASVKLNEDDKKIISLIKNKKAVILLNKIDLDIVTTEQNLQDMNPEFHIVPISAKHEKGINEFKKIVKEMFYREELNFNDEVFLTNSRQKDCLKHAYQSLELVTQSIEDGMPEDMFTIDLMNVYESLGFIIGEEVEEDLVNRIFKKFCMGK